MIGGAGYIGLNIVNGIINHQPINEHDNLVNLGIAAGAVGTGFFNKEVLFSEQVYPQAA